MKKINDALSDPIGRLLSFWRNRAVLPYIKGELIDLACGSNYLVKAYGGKGVDINDYGGGALIVSDMSKLPFADASFDTITCVASLYLFPQPLPILREASRIMRPDGQLILTMLNAKVLAKWYRWRDPTAFLENYTKEKLEKLLADAGLTIKSKHHFMFGLNTIYVIKK